MASSEVFDRTAKRSTSALFEVLFTLGEIALIFKRKERSDPICYSKSNREHVRNEDHLPLAPHQHRHLQPQHRLCLRAEGSRGASHELIVGEGDTVVLFTGADGRDEEVLRTAPRGDDGG